MKTNKVKRIMLLSILGMVAVFVTILSDFILIGRPNSAIDFMTLGTESMWDIVPWRITTGAFIGIMVLPFQLLGLVPLYFCMKPAGRVLPLVGVLINMHTLLMGVAFHISYAYIGSGWKLYHENDPYNQVTTQMVERFDFYWMLLSAILIVELIVSSIIFSWVILRGKSLFPKWMAICNPMIVTLATILVVVCLPYPVGGYIGPASLNVSTLVFFILILVTGYPALKKDLERGAILT